MIEFFVPGQPVPMARPRVTRAGHAYTPKRCAEYKARVAEAAKEAMKGKEMLTGAVQCMILLCYAVPKSYTKGKHLAAWHNIIKPIGRNSGDVDNIAKSIMDSCNGICWKDDSQVTLLRVRKMYGSESSARVQIFEDDWHD